MTAKQGSILFSLRYKALQFANIYSSTLVQDPFFLWISCHTLPLLKAVILQKLSVAIKTFLKYWYFSHCFLLPRSDMRSCCSSPEILKSNMPWYDHNLSSFDLSHTYIPDTNNFSMTVSCFCLYQKHLITTLYSQLPCRSPMIPKSKSPILNLCQNLPPPLTSLRYSMRISTMLISVNSSYSRMHLEKKKYKYFLFLKSLPTVWRKKKKKPASDCFSNSSELCVSASSWAYTCVFLPRG